VPKLRSIKEQVFECDTIGLVANDVIYHPREGKHFIVQGAKKANRVARSIL
jgi:hypothetical protein